MPERFEIRLTTLFPHQDDLPEIVIPLPDFAHHEFISIGRFLQHHGLVAHYERFGSPENPINFMHENVLREGFKQNVQMGDISPGGILVQSFDRASMLVREKFDHLNWAKNEKRPFIAALPFRNSGTMEVILVLNMGDGYTMIRVDHNGVLARATNYPNILEWRHSHQYGNFCLRIPPEWSFEITGDHQPSRQMRNHIVPFEIANMGEKSLYVFFEFEAIRVNNPARLSKPIKPDLCHLATDTLYLATDRAHLEPLGKNGLVPSGNISTKYTRFEFLYNTLAMFGDRVEFDTTRLITDDETRFLIAQQLLGHMETK